MATSDTVPGSWVVLLKPYVSEDGLASFTEAVQTAIQDPSKPHIKQNFNLPECRGFSGEFDLDTKEGTEKMDTVLSVEPNTVAYIIDTGMNKDHVDFESRASRWPKLVTSNPSASDEDVMGHGTHVAGTVGGKDHGVAKKANIISIKIFSDITRRARNDDIIKALEWVSSDAKLHGKTGVVNMSLGGPGPNSSLNAAVAATVRSGVPAPADNFCPASEPLAITVGSMDKTDEISDFSNYGRFVDAFGPGTDITSAWIGSTTAKETISGTSMATPHVTGLACCLLSDATLQEKTPYGVISELNLRADKNKLLGLDRVTSNIIVQV
ncbi:hypothetical protein G4B11_010546 [Aspergillus flavus]|nr:hypothetical protein G4B11_010546 [Aspergillus flavus]